MQRTTLTSATIDSAINRKKLRETLQETQEHREPPKKPATLPETTASPTDNQTSEGTQTRPNKSRVNNRKPHFTEQKSKRTVQNAKTRTNLKLTANYGCTSTQPHRKSRKPPRTHVVDGNRFYTAPRWAPDDPACSPERWNLPRQRIDLSTALNLRPSSRSTLRTCKRTERRRCGRSHSNAQVSDRTTKY